MNFVVFLCCCVEVLLFSFLYFCYKIQVLRICPIIFPLEINKGKHCTSSALLPPQRSSFALINLFFFFDQRSNPLPKKHLLYWIWLEHSLPHPSPFPLPAPTWWSSIGICCCCYFFYFHLLLFIVSHMVILTLKFHRSSTLNNN